jgi:hypothetical protein
MALMFTKNTNSFSLSLAAIGAAAETLNEWADEEAGLEAVQRILDSLDDIIALQDAFVDPDVLLSMLRDTKLHALLEVRVDFKFLSCSHPRVGFFFFCFFHNSFTTALVVR